MAASNGPSRRAARNNPRISKKPEERRQEIIETALALSSKERFMDRRLLSSPPVPLR